MVFLETKNIVKCYSDYLALNDISIKIPRSTIYGLLGPNGAGKTSLIRIINKIIVPDSGEIYLNDTPITSTDIFRIGYLPEERGLYQKMKVIEQIIFLGQLKGLSRKEAKTKGEDWLDRFDILEWKDKRIEQLSKGMAQKVQFISTVIHDPDLLILDEPFSGFDPVNAELLKNELFDMKANGKTIILSSHNMDFVESLCDEICLINNSKVMLQGNVCEVRDRYKQGVFRIVLKADSFNLLSNDFRVEASSKEREFLSVLIHKKVGCSNSSLLKTIGEHFEIVSFKEVLPSMNEIFIQTVSGE